MECRSDRPRIFHEFTNTDRRSFVNSWSHSRMVFLLAAKAKNTLTGTRPQADTSQLEREIDQLVYQLYGLTEEEIRIVEGKG